MSAGVFNQDDMRREFIESDPPRLKSTTDITKSPDPSSIDLPLGEEYYEMPASCRPSESYYVSDLIRRHKGVRHPLNEGTVFEPSKVYLARLAWGLELPNNVCARSTAKSSIGRLDALVRLIADKQTEFDRISQGVSTELYVEISPITFPLKVKPGLALSQIRFIKGTEELCTVPAQALMFEDVPVLVDRDGKSLEPKHSEGDPNAILLRLDLTPDPELGFAGFVVRKDIAEPIDPSIRRSKKEGEEDRRYNPKDFWEAVSADTDTNTVTIEKDRFYIFRSKERFRVPPHLSVECQAYSESLGDIRIHYAGFAHPYFGYDRDEGTPLIFEVRGHSLNTILRDGDPLAKVYFRRMTNPAKKDEDQIYNKQELQLSGCFKEWDK
jgi:dCTP deaminase